MAQVTAQLNYLHIAPRKVRAVAEVIRGMDIERARVQLEHIIRRPTKPLAKLLNSAVANAKNNFSMVEDNLFIKDVIVNEGITLKRFMPKGFGRAAPIHKKTSHIKIILEEKKPGLRVEKAPKKKEEGEKLSSQPIKIKKEVPRKPEIKKEIGKKGIFSGIKSAGQKMFRRKSI